MEYWTVSYFEPTKRNQRTFRCDPMVQGTREEVARQYRNRGYRITKIEPVLVFQNMQRKDNRKGRVEFNHCTECTNVWIPRGKDQLIDSECPYCGCTDCKLGTHKHPASAEEVARKQKEVDDAKKQALVELEERRQAFANIEKQPIRIWPIATSAALIAVIGICLVLA